jgi:hypothetical protein
MGRKKLNIESGEKYGRWTIVKEVENSVKPNGKKERQFICICECGNEKVIELFYLRKGESKSCGCLKKRVLGQTKHILYSTWFNMKQRCMNPNHKFYKNYGGRGIKVCDRWIKSFSNFLLDMGEKTEGMTLDRKNNDGNYEPSNCKWATRTEQSNNRRNTKSVKS